jgi:inner membrane protein
MPSIFSHAVFATAIGRASEPGILPLRFWVLTAACSMLPDIDAVGFAFGIRYNSIFGHRGLTHSIAFAVFTGVIVGSLVFRNQNIGIKTRVLILYFSLVTLSHPLLDALTNGGYGVALLAPFSGKRYFAPWRPIEVSPIGLEFFGAQGLAVFLSEITWIWIPSLLVLLLAVMIRRMRTDRKFLSEN